MRKIDVHVSGVTFEGRQAYLAQLRGGEPCRIVPEPENRYDANALAVHVAFGGEVWHIGYVPKHIAAEIAPYLDGETFMADGLQITGGFEMAGGEIANYGARIQVSIPDEAENK
jgi:hypothetical protein